MSIIIDVLQYVYYNRHMKLEEALNAFAALSQETRLKAFKIIIEYGEGGVAAGVVSDRLAIPHNSLSFHLSCLENAQLVSSRKEGRSIIYKANIKSVEGLIDYLRENCCVNESSSSSVDCLIEKSDPC